MRIVRLITDDGEIETRSSTSYQGNQEADSEIVVQIGETYLVEPHNPQKLKHRGRRCILLEASKDMHDRQAGTAKVRFYDTGRTGRVDLNDLVEAPPHEAIQSIVEVVQGPNAGRVGYVDDDDGKGNGIVYFGIPLKAKKYYVIPFRYLREAPAEKKEAYEAEYIAPLSPKFRQKFRI